MFDALIDFVREQYRTHDFIPLHAPVFSGNEKKYVVETVDSTFVSSVGAFVEKFENNIATYTGSPRAVATVNGTAALHVSLLLAGVKAGDLVITQPLTFVATCNAIAYCGAEPVFIDVDRHTLGLSPLALAAWLDEHARLDNDGVCRTKVGDRILRACLPMHTFGHPVELDALLEVCGRWGLIVIEDAAESLGSLYKGRHTGTFGSLGTLSFNGNKIITTGGGGMVLAGEELGARAKHITTTAKKPHAFEYVHDEVGYNYRLPNLNAALGCAQLENLETFVASKRLLASRYKEFFARHSVEFFIEPLGCRSNYWLNAILCENQRQRDSLLEITNKVGVMTRPIWKLMTHLPVYEKYRRGELTNALWLEERVVNLPSSVLPEPFP
ncbi:MULTISPECIES: LegC family aminotransferase [Pseudomonas aeruginosa group]|uniref:LegC family aminotransferase n=1 Tax=Pseudomonas aeruginosa group TaxID=136841 RepID=UPI00071B08CB|nr:MULTISPECIES: LegC family aminotransferase [Pseudomonas aeruginosa group]KSF82377.1 aminotransferase DegT [Pseudomonas aeruginosa]MBG3903924.1 LegC family aminotransferase [Pseudomonas aeruginosa]MBG4201547.1 LegC family aminotransferase [Pseudomonas aeruginosa]MBG4281755.1 LegC family aminotransferase [Pseudomonas aeruginosa]MBG6892264.1 LegC family aminotransferase [Pseudomonas aeruginosa]